MGTAGSEAQARKLAREAMRHYTKTLADFLRLPRVGNEEIDNLVRFDRWDLFDQGLAHGKGLIFATVHMGSWDMGGAKLGRQGYTFNVLADVFQASALNDKVVKTRQDKGFTIIPAGKVPKSAVAALKRNQILAILIDRPVKEGVTVSLFGAPTTLPAGLATLALRTGAAILPGCLLRNADGTTSGIVHELILPNPTGRLEEDIQDLTQQVVNSLETMILMDPGQWYAFRPMWPGHEENTSAMNGEKRKEALDTC